jgi:hypothetical protein
VKELFPEAQVTIGPVIENGFYYDFSYKRPFTPEDLAEIEKRMAELAKRDLPVAREEWKRDDAVKFFESDRREVQGRDHRRDPRRRRASASTARATSSTCAAGPTCRPRASSRSSS